MKEFSQAPARRLRFRTSVLHEGVSTKMEYRTLPLACECGRVSKGISAVGLSSNHELVIHWRCPRCNKNLCVVIPLSECWRMCFPDAPANVPKSSTNLTDDIQGDRKFLHSIGVSYSDE
jgi:hypothetical protein